MKKPDLSVKDWTEFMLTVLSLFWLLLIVIMWVIAEVTGETNYYLILYAAGGFATCIILIIAKMIDEKIERKEKEPKPLEKIEAHLAEMKNKRQDV